MFLPPLRKQEAEEKVRTSNKTSARGIFPLANFKKFILKGKKMKIVKEKLPGDEHGFYILPENDEKYDSMVGISYDLLKAIINKRNPILKDFKISSGKLVLTSIGQIQFCTQILWSFPTGIYKAVMHKDKETDTIFIPFCNFNTETIQIHILLTTFHVPDDFKIVPEHINAGAISDFGFDHFLMDEKEWDKYRATVYSTVHFSYQEMVNKINENDESHAIILPIEFNKQIKLHSKQGKPRFYFVYAGYT